MRPRLLILDDLFGRNVPEGRNTDRENLCAHFLWEDMTGDAAAKASKQKVLKPTAEVVFCRAQAAECSSIGETVENDLALALDAVRHGWPETAGMRRGRKPKMPRPRWSMVLIDLCFYTGSVTEESHRRTPGMPEGRPGDDDPRSYFGLTLLDAIHQEFPELPIFILSSKPRDQVSLEFSQRGALGFIDRSALDGPELLEQALWNHGLLADPAGEVVGQSLPMLLVLREARRAAGHRENVLIRGERGSGKELVARYLHRAISDSRFATPDLNQKSGIKNQESRASRPLVAVNSAAFSQNLFATELFGIQPRTSSGVDGKVGLIEMAKGGDLFLDEIADMPPEVQASIMRVLQERQITRVGSRENLPVDVRFLSATNAELESPDSAFRPELLDRLRTGGTIWLPPLRERMDDIPLLVEKFVRDAEAQRPGIRPRQVTPEAMERLQTHDWPGNVRELRGVIFDAVTRHPDVEYLVAGHLRLPKKGIRKQDSEIKPQEAQNGSTPNSLLDALRHCSFSPSEAGQWAGQLPQIQQEHNRLMARLLGAAIEATKRRTPDRPDGAVQIHPAARLATGNPVLTAAKAADLFKRLLGPIQEELEGDLAEAYQVSLRLRPKGIPARKKVTVR